MTTNSETPAELNGKKIVFPDAKRFADLFPSATAPDGEAPKLLETESWECGTWSDKGRKTRSYLSGWCNVSADDERGGRRSFHVSAAPEVIQFVRENMLAVPNDTKYFEVHVWDDGRALVTCSFGQIIGSYYLAIIDAATVPAKMETQAERDAETRRAARDAARSEVQRRHDEERAKYMAGETKHHDFYCFVADLIGLTDDMIPATEAKVHAALATGEGHLNEIPLPRWDGQNGPVRQKAFAAGMRSWSLSDTVCCLKAIARRRAERAIAA